MADLGALSGSREPSPSSTGLGPAGFDPARWERRLLIRCMGGVHCSHASGVCTADPEYQRYLAWKREGSRPPRQMRMQWHTEAGEVLLYYPSNMTMQDAADLRALIDLAFIGIDRRASAIEAASAAKTTEIGLAEGESAVAKPDAHTQSSFKGGEQ